MANPQLIETVGGDQLPAQSDRLRMEYVRVDAAVDALLDGNPKLHDLPQIYASIIENGFRDPPTFDSNLNRGKGGIVEGNGRITALRWGQDEGKEPPRGIFVLEDGWVMPMLFGLDARSESAAKRYAIDHNNLTMMGGELTASVMSRVYEPEAYLSLLQELQGTENLPLSVDQDSINSLLDQLVSDCDVKKFSAIKNEKPSGFVRSEYSTGSAVNTRNDDANETSSPPGNSNGGNEKYATNQGLDPGGEEAQNSQKFPFNCLLDYAMREIIYETINSVKKKFDIKDTGEALVLVCQRFQE